MIKAAILDKNRKYRYVLKRQWGNNDDNFVNFVLLNPSTADENNDDPTIKACVKFAQNWVYDGLYVTNLFALRATDPRDLIKSSEPIGKLNDRYIEEYARKSKAIIVAWGNHGTFLGRGDTVFNILSCIATVHCLGITKNGFPKHPLYIKKSIKPSIYVLKP